MKSEERTIIIGLGNPLRGDDGVGLAVVEALRESFIFPEDTIIIDAGTSDLEALLLMQGYHRAFLIDAANIGGKPGDWRCIPIHDISFIPEVLVHYGSFHNSGLKDAIALGQTLDILPKEIFIYAVQPEDLQFSMGLSDPNSEAVQEIIEDLNRRLGNGGIFHEDSNEKNMEE